MPFLDSSTIRPLYDVHDGGPPLGFRCMHGQNFEPMPPGKNNEFLRICDRVTRTLRGMVQHQRMVHGIKQHTEFNFDTIQRTNTSS